ncbi:hypothetical protein J2W23_000303 [Variovorax boronicumulans]|uniref:hypothetical protein n=1 Tax=Variovorax boronicumulans TaxID=436515 RepID=UPI0027803DFD|nr:hypothetical protein [Variovorax boronicumulans]MDQ0011939.1 hypothetical protein [Variovorax boronicumulans]
MAVDLGLADREVLLLLLRFMGRELTRPRWRFHAARNARYLPNDEVIAGGTHIEIDHDILHAECDAKPKTFRIE